MARKLIIGVMGPGRGASENDIRNATILGNLIAENGWILLNGGKNKGVMDASSRGSKSKNGVTIGVSSSWNKEDLSEFVDIPILTGMGSARNNINVLSSDFVIACGLGLGTISEIVLASKARKSVILLDDDDEIYHCLKKYEKGEINKVSTPQEAIDLIKNKFKK